MEDKKGSFFAGFASFFKNLSGNKFLRFFSKYIALGLFLLIIIVSSQLIWKSIEDSRICNNGQCLVNQRYYEEGSQLLNSALKNDPRNKSLWFDYALSLYKAGKAFECLKAFDTLFRLDPDFKKSDEIAHLIGLYRIDYLSSGYTDISFDIDPKSNQVYFERIEKDTNKDGKIDFLDETRIYSSPYNLENPVVKDTLSKYNVASYNIPRNGGKFFFSGYERSKVMHYTLEKVASLYYSGLITLDTAQSLYGSTVIPNSGIYSLDISTNEVKPLLVDKFDNVNPHTSPDGNIILFSSSRNEDKKGKSKIGGHFFMDTRTSNIINFYTDTDKDKLGITEWFPNSDKFLYNVYSESITGNTLKSDLYNYDITTKEYKKIGNAKSYYNASLSPDGNKIVANRITDDYNGDGAYTQADNYDTVIINNNNDEEVIFNSVDEIKPVFMRWLPSSDAILFSAYAYGRYGIYLYDLSSKSMKCITSSDDSFNNALCSIKPIDNDKFMLIIGNEPTKKEESLKKRICVIDLNQEFDVKTVRARLLAMLLGDLELKGYLEISPENFD